VLLHQPGIGLEGFLSLGHDARVDPKPIGRAQHNAHRAPPGHPPQGG